MENFGQLFLKKFTMELIKNSKSEIYYEKSIREKIKKKLQERLKNGG